MIKKKKTVLVILTKVIVLSVDTTVIVTRYDIIDHYRCCVGKNKKKS
jgi:hypothetical protein